MMTKWSVSGRVKLRAKTRSWRSSKWCVKPSYHTSKHV